MKRNKIILAGLAAAAIIIGLAAPQASADLPDPYVYLDYSTLNFDFTRTAAAGATGVVGTFTIADVSGSTLDAILYDDMGSELDRATISSFADFNVTVGGNVIRTAPEVYSLVGTLTATDDTGTTKVLADFTSTEVSNDPIGITNLFVIAGSLGTSGGGDGPILVNGVGNTWSFVGHLGDTAAANDVGNDDTITVAQNATQYDVGDLVDFTLGNNFGGLDALFADTGTIAGGNMKVTIIPLPGAIILGAIGLGLVGWLRRKSA